MTLAGALEGLPVGDILANVGLVLLGVVLGAAAICALAHWAFQSWRPPWW